MGYGKKMWCSQLIGIDNFLSSWTMFFNHRLQQFYFQTYHRLIKRGGAEPIQYVEGDWSISTSPTQIIYPLGFRAWNYTYLTHQILNLLIALGLLASLSVVRAPPPHFDNLPKPMNMVHITILNCQYFASHLVPLQLLCAAMKNWWWIYGKMRMPLGYQLTEKML